MSCSMCRATLDLGAKFCAECGHRVQGAAPPPPPAAAPPPPAAAPPPPYAGNSAPSAPPPSFQPPPPAAAAEPPRAYGQYIPPGAPIGAVRAIQHSECAICFDPMCSQPSGVLTRGGARVCVHFFHKRCITDVLNSNTSGATCPLCRNGFDGVMEVPSIETDPKRWFQCVDVNQDHKLSMQEVLEVMRAQLPVDATLLEEEMPELFRRFDHDGDGSITENELIAPNVGLLAFILQRYPKGERESVPDIRRDKHAWFRYFDYDKSGALEKEEVVRALIKSFRLSEDFAKLNMMREIVNAVWPIFDHDGSGTIEMMEFVQPGDGLADSVIASMGG